MAAAPRGVDPELQQLRQATRADDGHARTRALRELLRMDWRRAREAVMDALAVGGWGERHLVLRALAGRGDPMAQEALPHAEAALAAPEGPLATRALAEVAAVLLRHDQTAHARALCEACVGQAEKDSLAWARGRHVLGAVALRSRDAQGAAALLGEALARYRELGEQGHAARALDALGSALAARSDLEGAARAYAESLALKVTLGDRAGQAITHGGLGRLALQRGDLDEAAEHFTRDLEIARELGDDEGITVMSNQLADLRLREAHDARRAGDEALAAQLVARARQHVDEGVAPARRGGSLRDEGFTQLMQGRVALAEGLHHEADRLLERAAECFELADESAARHGVELLRAEAARARGDLAAARAHVDAAIGAFEEIGAIDGQVRGWMELALQQLTARHESAGREALTRARDLARGLAPSPTARALATVEKAREVAARLEARGVSSRDAARVVEDALTEGRSPGASVRRRGILDEASLARFLEDEMGVATIAPEALASPAQEAVVRLPHRAAARLRALPVAVEGDTLRVAVNDPLDAALRDQLALLTGAPVTLAYAGDEAALVRAIRRAYGRWLGLERRGDAAAGLRALVAYATSQRATAALLEPAPGEARVRVRVDDVLHEVDRVTPGFCAAMTSEAASRAGAWAVSSLATRDGPRVAITFAPAAAPSTLEAAGFSAEASAALRRAVSRREGLVLVVGCARSGRSTTLRALLAEVDRDARSVVAVSDAAEAWPAGVGVVVGARDAAQLDALARHEVDVAAVDPLADGAHARAALRLAGGALVLGALLDDDPRAAPREALGRWGVGAEALRGARVAVLTQRLVRRLCPGCRVRDRGRAALGWAHGAADAELVARAQGAARYARSHAGCESCGGRGYVGRQLVYGLWEPDDDGGAPLVRAAVELLASGVTSSEELARVMGDGAPRR